MAEWCRSAASTEIIQQKTLIKDRKHELSPGAHRRLFQQDNKSEEVISETQSWFLFYLRNQ